MTEIFNKANQKEKRRNLRKKQTPEELIFWSHIKSRRLGGFKFRRQYSINKYIADFYCPELQFVVEIDGGQHYEKENMEKDRLRSEYFTDLGLNIKRYTNVDIKNNLSGTLDDLLEYCNNLKPHPNPLLRKERE
jgi:very-short-patch-repair endonuclease